MRGKAVGFLLSCLALCLWVPLRAQDTLQSAANQAGADLEDALKRLAEVREEIAAEKIPLSKRLSGLEGQLLAAQRQHDEASRELDNRNLTAANLKNEITARSQEATHISNLLDEYIRGFESRVHIGELQRYRSTIGAARTTAVSGEPTTLSKLTEQMKVLEGALDRIKRVAGGEVFQGTALGPKGEVKNGSFALVGPVAVFASEDGAVAGLVGQKPGSKEPNVVDVKAGAFAKTIRDLVTSGQGEMPMDPKRGDTFKLAETGETLVGQIIRGGPTMAPILVLAACAMVVATIKWLQMANARGVSQEQLLTFFQDVNTRGVRAGLTHAKLLGGHVGEMLHAGLCHIGEPKELVEAIMLEKVLAARLKLNGLLPIVAICASAAPLLGLLGTVAGMIHTFKMVAIAGTGAATMLSGGIAEALVTTEYGLIVAIPSLLAHAFLSRKAAGLIQDMEKVAIAFLNRIPGGGESEESWRGARPAAA